MTERTVRDTAVLCGPCMSSDSSSRVEWAHDHG